MITSKIAYRRAKIIIITFNTGNTLRTQKNKMSSMLAEENPKIIKHLFIMSKNHLTVIHTFHDSINDNHRCV